MNAPCPNIIDCPGTDNPFANLSSEAPDFIYYKRMSFFQDTPPLGYSYSRLACAQVYNSTISQQDADEQAAIAAELCVHGTWTDQNGNSVVSYFNSQQQCSARCPDGNLFTYTVGAGRYSGLSQDQANQAAHSAACRLAQSHRLCLSSLPDAICYGVDATLKIFASATLNGGTLLWELVSGQVPDGMTFNGGNLASTHVTITGTPDVTGTYNFSVRCTAQNGDTMTKAYVLIVAGITNSLPIPDATKDSIYGPLQLNEVGFTGPVFTISDGALPSGMTMDVDGIISGTPTAAGNFNFTVSISETIGGPFTCDTPLILTVKTSGPTPFAYYKLDQTVGGSPPESLQTPDYFGNYDLDQYFLGFPPPPPLIFDPSGIIGNCYQFDPSFLLYNQSPDFALSSTVGFSIRLWIKTVGPIDSDILQGCGTTPSFICWNISILFGFIVKFRIAKTPFTNAQVVFTDIAVNDGNWHMIIATYNKATNLITINVDNSGSPASFPAASMDWSGGPGLSLTYPTPGDFSPVFVDEIAIYKEYVLTPADQTAEWNGGAGRTWPW